MELTAQQVEQLTTGLQTAIDGLKETRTKMDASNQEVGKLLEQQKKLEQAGGNNEAAIKEVKTQLDGLAIKMTGIAEQHNALLAQQRTMMTQLAQTGEAEDTAYSYRGPNSHGSVFASKQQAIEIGMWAMATMGRQTEAKVRARKWLQENKSGLRYLPNIPKSFVEDFGAQWIQTVREAEQNHGMVQDLTGGSTPGSILTRPQFADTLIRNVEQYGVFRQDALVWPMGADTVYIPRRKSGFTINWEGEGGQGASGDPDFELLSMVAKKMFNLHYFSSELSMDAVIPLADILMFEIATAIAYEEDRIGFNGNGAGGNSPGYAGFVGVLGMTRNGDTSPIGPIAVTGAAGNDLTTEITEAKLRAMTGQLHTWARSGAKWYWSRSVFADICGIQQGTAGGPVVQFLQGRPASMLGYSVRETEVLPASPGAASTAIGALGDLRKGWALGDRGQVEIETSEHFKFDTDQMAMRWKKRVAFCPIQPNSMVVYVSGTS